jgi:hypothetical protein
LLFDFFCKRLAFVVGHGDENLLILGLPFGGFADFIDRANIGMVERRSRLRLINEAHSGLFVPGLRHWRLWRHGGRQGRRGSAPAAGI